VPRTRRHGRDEARARHPWQACGAGQTDAAEKKLEREQRGERNAMGTGAVGRSAGRGEDARAGAPRLEITTALSGEKNHRERERRGGIR
jgi:hypothetical protein